MLLLIPRFYTVLYWNEVIIFVLNNSRISKVIF